MKEVALATSEPRAYAVQGLALQRACACGSHTAAGDCAGCRDMRGILQRRGTTSKTEVPPIVSDVLRSPGHVLDTLTRVEMESRFGHDFSHVRVHTDQQAAESASAVNALAYTVGSNVVFGTGLYKPNSSEGRQLLAHELTHVVQQGPGSRPMSANLSTIDPDPHAEAEARRSANSFRSPHIGNAAFQAPALQRSIKNETVEEKSIPTAQAWGFLTADASKTSSAFAKALSATKDEKEAEALVKKSGEDLWNAATSAAKGGGAGTDDRQLYWTRLMMTAELRKWSPSWIKDADALGKLQTRMLQLLEQTSRGMTSATFPADKDKKRILASGFDPFGFPNKSGDIRQSNLSGAIALALDGETLTEGKVSARVESAVFPVRYADFNEGIVENYLRPHLTGANPPHLVMSISQGSSEFELEEFAGRRRSTDKYADNLGEFGGGGSPTKPIVPPGIGSGAEFIPHTVPAPMLGAMRGAAGRKGAITEETKVIDLPPGATATRDLEQGPGSTPESKKTPGLAVEGSGGGFLSNEIFYRNSLLQTSLGTKVPMIHMHTPQLPPGVADAKRNGFIETAKKILRAAVPHL